LFDISHINFLCIPEYFDHRLGLCVLGFGFAYVKHWKEQAGLAASARNPSDPYWLHCHQPVRLLLRLSLAPHRGQTPVATVLAASAPAFANRSSEQRLHSVEYLLHTRPHLQ
jgi:hypothetical protein